MVEHPWALTRDTTVYTQHVLHGIACSIPVAIDYYSVMYVYSRPLHDLMTLTNIELKQLQLKQPHMALSGVVDRYG